MGLAHWDDVEARRMDGDGLGGTVQDLGGAAGSVEVGLVRRRPDPGTHTNPTVLDGREEELVFVRTGSGWGQDAAGVVAVRAGDCVASGAHAGPAFAAGDDGLDLLAFGPPGLVEMWAEEPFDVSSPRERPPNVVNLDDVEPAPRRRGRTDRLRRDLGRAAGSVRTGLAHLVVAPGAEAAPPHLHTAEEELFVVLAGSGELVLGHAETEERHRVRAGSVVARPAGSQLAHTFVASRDGELVLLAYGQRDPRDVCWYPRSQKVSLRGAGVTFRVEPLDYWDGEE